MIRAALRRHIYADGRSGTSAGRTNPDPGRGPVATARGPRKRGRGRRPDAFTIVLAHHPHAFDRAAAAGVPLTLAGHTHGGQFMLTRDIGAGSILFKYCSGLYRQGPSALVVSNGVENWFPLRINAPAEILHLTLRSTPKTQVPGTADRGPRHIAKDQTKTRLL